MPREKTFLIMLFMLLLGGLLISLYYPDSLTITDYSFPEGQHPIPQTVDKRLVRTVKFHRDLEIGRNGEISNAVALQIDQAGRIFVFDLSEHGVKRFSEDTGKFVGLYQSPFFGDGSFPVHFWADRDGKVWVADGLLSSVHLLSSKRTLLKVVRTHNRPHRVVVVSDKLFTMATSPDECLFYKYDENGKRLHGFGRLLAGRLQDPLLLDGWLTLDSQENLIYAALHIGMLASYTQRGELKFLRETIDGADSIPRVITDSSGKKVIEPGSPLRSFFVNASRGKLYVLSALPQGFGSERIMDVYSEEDGTYMHSFELPVRASFAYVDNDWLYCGTSKLITRWKLKM